MLFVLRVIRRPYVLQPSVLCPSTQCSMFLYINMLSVLWGRRLGSWTSSLNAIWATCWVELTCPQLGGDRLSALFLLIWLFPRCSCSEIYVDLMTCFFQVFSKLLFFFVLLLFLSRALGQLSQELFRWYDLCCSFCNEDLNTIVCRLLLKGGGLRIPPRSSQRHRSLLSRAKCPGIIL